MEKGSDYFLLLTYEGKETVTVVPSLTVLFTSTDAW